MRFTPLLLLFLFSVSSQAQYFQADLMKKRLSNKESSRWTLSDWLTQKQKISFWDQWLAMNRSANIFELELTGSKFDFEESSQNSSTGLTQREESTSHYDVGLWISIFGLAGEFQESNPTEEATTYQAKLRLIGTSLQSTHVLLGGGQQTFKIGSSNEEWQNTIASATLKMYFLKFIGLESEYTKYFKSDESQLGRTREGYRVRSGAFIEYGILKIFGHYWRQNLDLKTPASGVTENQVRDGLEAGVSLIF